MAVTFKPGELDTIEAYDDDEYQLASIDPNARSWRPGDNSYYTIVCYGRGFGLTKFFGPANDPDALARAKAWITRNAGDLTDNDICERL